MQASNYWQSMQRKLINVITKKIMWLINTAVTTMNLMHLML